MRVCVTGGAGEMAGAAILDLIESGDVSAIVLADQNRSAIEARANELRCSKVSTAEVDVRHRDALVKILRDCDVCLNASLAYFNEAIMEACLEAQTHYTDLGGLFHWAKKQLAFSDRFAKAGLSAVVGSGSAPGIVNVMARYAYLRLDTVESVRIVDGIVNFGQPSAPLVAPYSLDTILNEFIMNPWAFVDGDWKEFPPFSGAEEVDFPEPVGRQTVFYTIHSEPMTIPISFRDKGIREVSFKLSLPKTFEERLRFLVDLGLADKEPVRVNGVSVTPRDLLLHLVDKSTGTAPQGAAAPNDHKVLRVTIRGTKAQHQEEYVLETVLHPYEEWNLPCSSFTVGFPAAVTTRLLGTRVIDQAGVFGGEACIPPEAYFSELARRGIRVRVTQNVV